MHHHLTHYLALLGILVAAILGFVFFSYDRGFQVALAIGVSFAYFAWGIIHHTIHKDLYLVVALEYLFISAIGFLILLSLIYRA